MGQVGNGEYQPTALLEDNNPRLLNLTRVPGLGEGRKQLDLWLR